VQELGQMDQQTEQEIQLKLKVKSAKAKSITLKWNSVKGATKLELYRAVKTNKKYKKIKTFKPGVKTFTDKKVSMKKRYYYGLTATVGGEEINSNFVIKSKVRGKYKRGSVYGPYLSKKKLIKVRDLVANVVNKYQIELAPVKDRIYMIHDYLVKKVSYHAGGSYVGSALGALKYRKAQCSGYSRAFVALCDGAGVKSKYVHASGSAMNPYHQWNMVKLSGKWYLIDVQGNDSSRFDMCFLLGRDKMKGFYKSAYKYNKKKYPPLARKSLPARKYRYFSI
jgi:transglutaminase/protease-like cytokinesis protein 3